MGALAFLCEVTYADGRTDKVNTDQRDMAAFELDSVAGGNSFGKAMHTRTFIAFRFIAWHALKREGRTRLSFSKWSEEAVNVDTIEDEEGAADDPGQRAASAETSSDSA